MRNSQIEVRPIAGTIGAEIHNVDVSQELDEATIGDIRKALLDHCVIFFRDQKLDAERHKAFTRRFGKIFIHPNYKGMQADAEIITITREPGDKKIVGEEWHADTTMMPEPPMGAILYGVEVPPYGGDTLFANQAQAYEALSEGMKKMLAGVKAIHSDRKVAGPAANKNAFRATKVREDADWRETVSVHPVVVAHPETGRKQLFVNASYTDGLRGHDGGGEQAAARLPARPRAPAGVHLPLPLGHGLDRLLGQPRLQAPRHPRRRPVPPRHAPHAGRRRAVGLIAITALNDERRAQTPRRSFDET